MTPKDLFLAAYKRTVTATGAKFDAAHMDECYKAVAEFPASLYDAAATTLNAASKWLPKPSEWRETVSALAQDRERVEREEAAAEWARQTSEENKYHCSVCRDTGWEPGECTSDNWCGRCRIHKVHLYDHPFVTECACRLSNPVYQEKRHKIRPVDSDPSRSEAARLKSHYRRQGGMDQVTS